MPSWLIVPCSQMMKRIDTKMSGVIKRLVRSGKPKGIVLPPGEQITGQTNSANPGTISKLLTAYADVERAQSQPYPAKPGKPQKRMPFVDDKFETMGKEIGVCPYELQAIMTAEFSSDQTMIFEMLKKFIALVKLSAAVDLSEVHKDLKEAEQTYRRQYERWENECAKADATINAISDGITRAENAFASAWGDILVDLVTKIERKPDINALGDWDKWMVYAIASHGNRYAKIHANGRVSISFKDCKTMEPEKVSKLHEVARKTKKHEENNQWLLQLDKLPVNSLMKMLWSFDPENETDEDGIRREQLEWAIASKSGRTVIRDRWGNLDWGATFASSSFLNDFGEPEYEYDVDMPDDLYSYEDRKREAKYKAELKKKLADHKW